MARQPQVAANEDIHRPLSLYSTQTRIMILDDVTGLRNDAYFRRFVRPENSAYFGALAMYVDNGRLIHSGAFSGNVNSIEAAKRFALHICRTDPVPGMDPDHCTIVAISVPEDYQQNPDALRLAHNATSDFAEYITPSIRNVVIASSASGHTVLREAQGDSLEATRIAAVRECNNNAQRLYNNDSVTRPRPESCRVIWERR